MRWNHHYALAFCLSMISAQTRSAFVARENRFPPRIKCGACFSGSCSKSRMGVIGARTPAVKTGTCACRMITFSLRHANEGAHHPAQVSASRAVTLDLRPKVRKRIDDASKVSALSAFRTGMKSSVSWAYQCRKNAGYEDPARATICPASLLSTNLVCAN